MARIAQRSRPRNHAQGGPNNSTNIHLRLKPSVAEAATRRSVGDQEPSVSAGARATASELEAMGHRKRPMLAVMREKCLDCTGGAVKEVRLCHIHSCPLWPFRMGSNPWRPAATEAQRAAGRGQAEKNRRPQNEPQDFSGDQESNHGVQGSSPRNGGAAENTRENAGSLSSFDDPRLGWNGARDGEVEG